MCTIEKANSLVNKLIQEGQIGQLTCLVVDEMHMMGGTFLPTSVPFTHNHLTSALHSTHTRTYTQTPTAATSSSSS